MTTEIVEVPPEDARLAPLIGALRAELDARYPEEIQFEHPTVREAARFLLATVDGVAVGCCAMQPLGDGGAELKRMYVVPGMRGRGLAGQLMTEAERLAVRLGFTRIRLETGVRQPEAIAVYERAGFTPIPNYPPYDQWDMSRCYAKPIQGQAAVRMSGP
jgi:GNAT superfamily N-acetyltransferase